MTPLIDTAQFAGRQLERRDAAAAAADAPAAQSDSRGWNVLVTAKPEPDAVSGLLHGLRRFGVFDPTPYACVCVGRVHDTSTFLDALLEAEHAGRAWTRHLSRVVCVVRQFEFAPDALEGKLELAAAAVAERVRSGTFQMGAEWRGAPAGANVSHLEDLMARALVEAGHARGKDLMRAFDDADYVVAIEIVGESCGVGLLDRAMRERYPFVRVR